MVETTTFVGIYRGIVSFQGVLGGASLLEFLDFMLFGKTVSVVRNPLGYFFGHPLGK